jgi:hypothetical protein
MQVGPGFRFSGVTMEGNTFRQASGGTGTGINVFYADDLVFAGNKVFAPTTAMSVLIANCTRSTISSNVLTNCRLVAGSVGGTVTGNDVVAGSSQFALSLASSQTATGNKLKGGNNPGPVVAMDNATDCVVADNVLESTVAFNPSVTESGTAANNLYQGNRCIYPGNPNGGFNLVASNGSIVRSNHGWVTENGGSASKSNGQTIAHGLSVTPTKVTVTGSVAKRIAGVTAVDATNITIALYDDTGTAVSVAEPVYWEARK